MPEPIGEFVTDTTDGKPDADSDSRKPDTATVRTGEPEILHGFETESPDTESIDAGGGRRTKSGAIDGRTLRGKRGPGRPRNSEKEASIRLEKIGLTDLLYSLHLMGANILNAPNLELDQEESKKLADAVQKVAGFYSVAFDPKKVAIVELAAVCGMIYGPRIMAWRIDRKKKAPAPRVTEMPRPAQAPAQPVQAPARGGAGGLYTPSQVFGDASAGLG